MNDHDMFPTHARSHTRTHELFTFSIYYSVLGMCLTTMYIVGKYGEGKAVGL